MAPLDKRLIQPATPRARRTAGLLSHTVARFGLVGVLNSLIGLATIYLAKWLGGLGDVPANLVGYSIGLLSSFLLNRRFTFDSSAPYWPALVRFMAVVAIGYGSNLAVVLIAVEWLKCNSYIAQALGILPYTTIVYFGCKAFVFRTTSQ